MAAVSGGETGISVVVSLLGTGERSALSATTDSLTFWPSGWRISSWNCTWLLAGEYNTLPVRSWSASMYSCCGKLLPSLIERSPALDRVMEVMLRFREARLCCRPTPAPNSVVTSLAGFAGRGRPPPPGGRKGIQAASK